MNERDELESLRRLAELEAKAGGASVMDPQPERPRYRDVLQNASRGAVAAIPDMIINTPANLYNLGAMGYGAAATAAGRSDLAPEITPPPDFVRGQFEKRGWITPQAEPQTQGERYLAAGTQGATAGAVGGLPGMAMGAASNLIGEGVSHATGSPTMGLAANLMTPMNANAARLLGSNRVAVANALQSQKAPLTETMKEVRGAGYVMPPAMTNPTGFNKVVESLGGKAATQQDASMRNQAATDALMRKELRLPPETGLTDDALGAVATQRAQPYRDVAALPGLPAPTYTTQLNPMRPPYSMAGTTPATPETLIHDWKSINSRSKELWRDYQRNAKVETLDQYKASKQTQASIEQKIEDSAIASGRPELVDQLRAARTDIAKIHDVERALNIDRGETSAIDLAKARDRGVPLSGELLTAAKMGNSFGKAVQRPEQIGSPGVNNLNTMMGGIGGGGIGGVVGALGGGAGGAGVGAMMGSAAGAIATPMVQSAIRKIILSKPYQNYMGTPSYKAPMLARGASNIPQSSGLDASLSAYIQSQRPDDPDIQALRRATIAAALGSAQGQ